MVEPVLGDMTWTILVGSLTYEATERKGKKGVSNLYTFKYVIAPLTLVHRDRTDLIAQKFQT
jgi:hypothetical protein